MFCRIAQEELRQQLENLSEQLKAIEQIQTTPPELDIYVRKLINIKHKVTVVFSVLQGAQVRLIDKLLKKKNLAQSNWINAYFILGTIK